MSDTHTTLRPLILDPPVASPIPDDAVAYDIDTGAWLYTHEEWTLAMGALHDVALVFVDPTDEEEIS